MEEGGREGQVWRREGGVGVEEGGVGVGERHDFVKALSFQGTYTGLHKGGGYIYKIVNVGCLSPPPTQSVKALQFILSINAHS